MLHHPTRHLRLCGVAVILSQDSGASVSRLQQVASCLHHGRKESNTFSITQHDTVRHPGKAPPQAACGRHGMLRGRNLRLDAHL
jgi:hypothetical protein